jgi:HAD superfamily hydrolase (TIGR01509 family)
LGAQFELSGIGDHVRQAGNRRHASRIDIAYRHDRVPQNRAAEMIAHPMSYLVERYAALLFDLDGTLVDTMPLHYRAYADTFAARGLRLTEADFMAQIGAPARDAIPSFLKAAGAREIAPHQVAEIHSEKKQLFERDIKVSSPRPLPAAAFLAVARGRQKLAVVSSGNRAGVMAILDAMGWEGMFDAVVSGDDVARGKPDPEPYLAAAMALKVSPSDCLVLEDTEAGIASGRAAGMSVLDVTKLIRTECSTNPAD